MASLLEKKVKIPNLKLNNGVEIPALGIGTSRVRVLKF